MVAVSLFRERVFTGGLIALMMWGFGLFGIYFFTSLYLQGVLGFSPTKAGRGVRPDGAADGGRRGRVRAGVPPVRRVPVGRVGDAADGGSASRRSACSARTRVPGR